jgi:hypothetical protein
MYKQKKDVSKPEDCVEINIGSKESPKLIKVGKNLSTKERRMIEDLVREYRDVFAWTYDDLKAYKGDIIQHTIPLKEGAKPFRQKLRKINPKLTPLSKRSFKRCWMQRIIAPTRHSSWLENLVVVRKKNEK